ncbi:MAG TPA: hypothetical protein VNN72_18380 [Polyangiaceae bacterium]|nr:hypothetical protein [Polyangiaceae bacterium]
MKLSEGDNHLISARHGIATCQVWVRADLSPEDGARSARQMSDYLTQNVLYQDSPYRGVIFDLRKAPPVFGPKTREALAGFFAAAARAGISVAVLVGESAIQVLQFRNLCRDAGGRADVFDNETDAVRWFGPSTLPGDAVLGNSSKPPR